MAYSISNNTSLMSPAVAVGCSPPFKALFTRRFSTVPGSPVQKRFSFLRSSSSVPGHSPFHFRPCERARRLNDTDPTPYLYDGNFGGTSSVNRASSCTYGSEEAFGSRVSTLERHVEAVKGLDRGDNGGSQDGFDADGIRMQHDFVGQSLIPMAITADMRSCEGLFPCAILADVPKQLKSELTSYRLAIYSLKDLPDLVDLGEW